MKILLVLNDAPYGSEKCFNALRMAHALLKEAPDTEVAVFLMADAVVAARAGQKTPDGYYNLERMLKRLASGRNRVLLCGTCMDARGLTDADVLPGAKRSTMPELSRLTLEADKVLVF